MKKIILLILSIFGITFGAQAQLESLDTGLTRVLEWSLSNLKEKNIAFLIDISKNDTIMFQIIHGGLVKEIRTVDNSFNFSIDLPFDNEPIKEEKFKKLEISSKFILHYTSDGISCYALNFGADANECKKITLTIMKEVYGYNSNELFKFSISNMSEYMKP